MDFVATQDFKSPYVISTGMPHKPTQIKTKAFKRGEIIVGEMKTDKYGKPAFVMHKGVMVVPLSCVKIVVTKDINPNVTSNADGGDISAKPKTVVVNNKSTATATATEKKKKYLDGMILGALAGFGATYYAEKKGWIPLPEQKNKIIGAVVGALAGAYMVFRFTK
jgi:hypothetical protein